MIWSSRIGKITVLLASAGAHGMAVYLWWSEPEVQMDGGAEPTVQARLGNNFEDLTRGTMVPLTPETVEEAEPPEPIENETAETEVEKPIEQSETENETPVEETETVETTPTEQAVPERTETDAPNEQLVAPALPEDATLSETALALAPAVTDADRADLAAPVEAVPLEAAEPTEPVAPTPERIEPEITEAVRPEPTVTAAAPPPETLQALPEIGVQVSRRPQVRPESIEEEAEQRRQVVQEQPQRREPEPAPRVQQGNAQQNATAGGATTNSQSQPAQESANTGRSTTAGNAAASNYPGQVMRKLNRVPKPRVGSRGTVVVNFVIAASGGLSGVSVVRSSGSARLDQAALQVVRRAAPFPRPPAGAKRSFQISIKGQG
ncbi:MAG: energy transducer TonB [Pseudomonadota bacterium]